MPLISHNFLSFLCCVLNKKNFNWHGTFSFPRKLNFVNLLLDRSPNTGAMTDIQWTYIAFPISLSIRPFIQSVKVGSRFDSFTNHTCRPVPFTFLEDSGLRIIGHPEYH